MCAVRNDRYPHVFSPLKIRGVTLKNRLEYSPTVVLKCTPEGDVTEEMLDYVEYQAKTGVAYLTIGNTPVVHTGSSAWLCELNVTEDRCIHGINQLVVRARENGAEMSVELAHAGRGATTMPGVIGLASSDVPFNGGPLGSIKPMNYEDIPSFAEYQEVLRQADPSAGFGDLLLELMKAETASRQENQNRRRLKAAGFPNLKTMEEFDCSQLNDTVSHLFLQELASCQFVQNRQNIIMIGNPGRGKTHLAIALECRFHFFHSAGVNIHPLRWIFRVRIK